MDYKLELQAVGAAGDGDADPYEAELPWRLFSHSLLAQLPHAWRHPHDSALGLARFERSRRVCAARPAAQPTGPHPTPRPELHPKYRLHTCAVSGRTAH
eukprot:4792010-Prymnesium_polylepis.1